MKNLIILIALFVFPQTIKAQLMESECRISHPTCFGSNDGSITILLDNINDYSFQWNTGAKGAYIDQLYGGDYECIITDKEGNIVVQNFKLVRPEPLSVGVSRCHFKGENDLGSCVAHVSGGTGTYKYQWSTNSQSAGIDNLRPGFYTVEVQDENHCSLDLTIEIKDKSTSDARLSNTSASVN